jgi:hypothetical protein
MFTELRELWEKITKWFSDELAQRRKSDNDSGQGRRWFVKSIGYSKRFVLEDLRTITNRDNLNDQYVQRFEHEEVQGRKGISALKIEISALYSFQKSFVERHKGRMHFYRDDLSQKGARNPYSMGQSFGIFEAFKEGLDT